jgi:hypothetical protein
LRSLNKRWLSKLKVRRIRMMRLGSHWIHLYSMDSIPPVHHQCRVFH